jgi:hypothetical protein
MGEFNLCYAGAACAFSVLVKDKLKVSHLLLLFFLSFILALSYEAMAFIGPLLLVFALYRIMNRKLGDPHIYIFLLSMSAFFFALGAMISIFSILFPRDPANLDSAMDLMDLVMSQQFLLIFLAIGMFIVFLRQNWHTNLVATVLPFIVPLYFLLNQEQLVIGGLTYRWRALSGLLLFLVLSYGFLHYVRSQNNLNRQDKISLPSTTSSLALFLTLSILSATESIQFVSWLKNYEKASIQSSEWVNIDRVDHSKSESIGLAKYAWGWSNPSLSGLLRGDLDAGILRSSTSEGSWQPFDPLQTVPNPLRGYSKKSSIFPFKN